MKVKIHKRYFFPWCTRHLGAPPYKQDEGAPHSFQGLKSAFWYILRGSAPNGPRRILYGTFWSTEPKKI